jgi:hypothetical protein
MFYLSQSEISFPIITVESNFGVGTVQAKSFAENILPKILFSTNLHALKNYQTEPNSRYML